jgi:hypothetical protein
MDRFPTMHRSCVLAIAGVVLLSGCAGIAQRATDRFSSNLSQAVLGHDDPATVRDGLPAYLLLLDSLVVGSPDSAPTLRAAADMYASYAGSFVDDPARAATLSTRARDYARRAARIDLPALCTALEQPYATFEKEVAGITSSHVATAYSLAGAWAAWIQTHADGFEAIADIPRVEALLQRVAVLAPEHDGGMAWVYIGVLNSLRPEAVGGKPEQGRAAFERAVEISNGRNLMAKTLFARHYARLVFDQALHDRLLHDVVAADPHEPGRTLINVLAQAQARELLRTSPDYF